MKRRWRWASRAATTSSIGRMVRSSHGDTVDIGAGRSGPSNKSRDTKRWVQVTPHFDGAEITMSPSRNSRASQRRLSLIHDR